MTDKWAWEREKFAEMRIDGKRDTYEMLTFNMLGCVGMEVLTNGEAKLTTHYDGLQVYHLRKTVRGIDQVQTLLVSPEGELLDFCCEPKDEEIPRLPPLTREQIEAKLREKGMWPKKRRRNR